MRTWALAWKEASGGNREQLYKDHGLAWSELWRLPYWDIRRQLVVDGMHCFYEGLAHHYFRDYLGLTDKQAKEVSKVQPAFSYNFKVPVPQKTSLNENETRDINLIHHHLVLPLDFTSVEEVDHVKRTLGSYAFNALQFVVEDLKLPLTWEGPRESPTRKIMVEALIDWVS
jgi:hypothetical protein